MVSPEKRLLDALMNVENATIVEDPNGDAPVSVTRDDVGLVLTQQMVIDDKEEDDIIVLTRPQVVRMVEVFQEYLREVN